MSHATVSLADGEHDDENKGTELPNPKIAIQPIFVFPQIKTSVRLISTAADKTRTEYRFEAETGRNSPRSHSLHSEERHGLTRASLLRKRSPSSLVLSPLAARFHLTSTALEKFILPPCEGENWLRFACAVARFAVIFRISRTLSI